MASDTKFPFLEGSQALSIYELCNYLNKVVISGEKCHKGK